MARTKERDPRLALPPPRTYAVPGGPLAIDLGEVEVAVLSEFERGGDEDAGYGNKR